MSFFLYAKDQVRKIKVTVNARFFTKIVSGLFLLILVGACQQMDREAYIEWVQDYDNGLHVKKIAQNHVFDVQYLPPYYRWLQTYNGQPLDVPGARPPRDGLQYYLLKVGFEDGRTDLIKGVSKDKKIWQQRAYYFSYRFQEHLYLEEGGRKLPCELFHFEKAFDLRPQRTFVLGFALGRGKDVNMVIDSPAFGTKPVKIAVSKNNIPNLEL